MEEIRTLLDGFEEMVVKVYPILEAASNRGIPVDEDERLKLERELGEDRIRIYESIQIKVPDEIRNIHPKEGYVRVPAAVQDLVNIYNINIGRLQAAGKKVIGLDEFVAKKSYHQIIKAGEASKIWGRFRYARFSVLDKKTLEESEVGRWVRVDDFNPNASKQIIAYMKAKGHKVPVKLDGNETSEAKELERLAISTKDILYDEIIEYRQINKMLTNDIPNWKPVKDTDKEGAGEATEGETTASVHTEFGFYTATGQINSRRPNVQNANKHKPLGKRFRRIIRARDYRDRSPSRGGGLAGRRRVLVEADYSGFHALMLGREAQSARYMFLASNDIHSWFGSHIIGKPIEYPDISNLESLARFKSRLKEFKEEHKVVRDTQAKPTILGVGLGLGPRKMYWMNRERWDKKLNQVVGIKDEAQSKKLQGILKELLPEIFQYQERQKEKAFRQTYLISRWGMIRWFFDVRGEDGEAAIAFEVQGNAHGMLRWVMRRLEDEVQYGEDKIDMKWHIAMGYNYYQQEMIKKVSANDRFHFINTIHDSLIFEPWEDEMEECINVVTKTMETPCLVLADKKVAPMGLVVRTEATWGLNWAEYDEKKNPEGMRVWKQ